MADTFLSSPTCDDTEKCIVETLGRRQVLRITIPTKGCSIAGSARKTVPA